MKSKQLPANLNLKMKKVEEIKKYRSMDNKALEAELTSLEKELNLNVLKVKADKAKNYSLISKTKKNIARIKTIISEKDAE